jgi:hypothetical protein
MRSVRPWLALFDWDVVTAQNAVLCEAKNALHKPTSDGHEATKSLWNSRHKDEMNLEQATDLCRQCHRMAPFCFYNGNTFASIIRLVIKKLEIEPARGAVARSLAGHIVAGVATEEEERAFREFCAWLEG